MYTRFTLFAPIITLLICILLFGCATSPRYTRGRGAIRPSVHSKKKIIASPGKHAGEHALRGVASYYGTGFHGKKTASGERFNMHDLTAAHKTLPFNTRVKVINLANRKSVIVRINDRGPYKKGRIIDLSKAAAQKIGMMKNGTVKVRLIILN